VCLRQFVGMLRFVAELPGILKQLAGTQKAKLKRELDRLLKLVEEPKGAIGNAQRECGKKKGPMVRRAHRVAARTATAAASGVELVLHVPAKTSTCFKNPKDMTNLLMNTAILDQHSRPTVFLMMAAANRQISEHKERHAGATDNDAAEALEADPAAAQALAIVGGVGPGAFEQAMIDLQDVMGKNHGEAMALVRDCGSRLDKGPRAIRAEVSHVGRKADGLGAQLVDKTDDNTKAMMQMAQMVMGGFAKQQAQSAAQTSLLLAQAPAHNPGDLAELSKLKAELQQSRAENVALADAKTGLKIFLCSRRP
jgi:hypothetical protein